MLEVLQETARALARYAASIAVSRGATWQTRAPRSTSASTRSATAALPPSSSTSRQSPPLDRRRLDDRPEARPEVGERATGAVDVAANLDAVDGALELGAARDRLDGAGADDPTA